MNINEFTVKDSGYYGYYISNGWSIYLRKDGSLGESTCDDKSNTSMGYWDSEEEAQAFLDSFKNPTKEEKIKAATILGLRDEYLKSIDIEQRDRDALLITVLIQQKAKKAAFEAHRKEVEILKDFLKSAEKAKRLANKRADEAERKLKEIQKLMR